MVAEEAERWQWWQRNGINKRERWQKRKYKGQWWWKSDQKKAEEAET